MEHYGRDMRNGSGRWVRGWLSSAIIVFVVAGASAPEVLRAIGLSWPPWLVAALIAAVPTLVGLVKPLADAEIQARANRATRRSELSHRRADLLVAVSGRRALPRVREMTDRALLGIHPAIPLPSDADDTLSAEFPMYVPRDLEPDLRTWVTARKTSGGFVLLVGPSASGKTRCMHQMLLDTVPDWNLFLPATGQEVNSFAEAGVGSARTVVWLDDIDNFIGVNGLTVATLRRILADRTCPTLVVGTILPDRFDLFTRAPHGEGNGSEFSRDGYEILNRFATRFDLAGEFSLSEQERVRQLAERDPRLAEALQNRGSANITETLAAAPELIRRWRNSANEFGAAVITAAVIARRCGHPVPVPEVVLLALAERVLTPEQRAAAAPDWFTDSVTWACQPVRGRAAPLTPYASTVGLVGGYRVSDVLVQYAATSSDPTVSRIPEEMWHVLITHATPDACVDVAWAAYSEARLEDVAELAMRKGAADGGVQEMTVLGFWLEQRNPEEAEQLYRSAVSAGSTHAMSHLGSLLRRGSSAEAEEWLRKAANSGDTDAMVELGFLLEGDAPEESEVLWRQAADKNYSKAAYCLGISLARSGSAEAEEWLLRALEGGYEKARCVLSDVVLAKHDPQAAEKLWRHDAEVGDDHAMFHLGVLLLMRDLVADAEQWLRRAADKGNTRAMYWLGESLSEREPDMAEDFYVSAAEAGESDAMVLLSFMLEEIDPDRSKHWLRRAADAGHGVAMNNLGSLLKVEGEVDEAETWFVRAAEEGMSRAKANLGELNLVRGEFERAKEWFQQAVDAGYDGAFTSLGIVTWELGSPDEAEEFLRRGTDIGDARAMAVLAALLEKQEENDEVEPLLRRAAELGEVGAIGHLGAILFKNDEVVEAEELLRRASEAEHPYAMKYLARLLTKRGDLDEAEIWNQRAESILGEDER